MATQRQIEANRRNGRRSTGPRTVSGKMNSRRNALTHGARAQAVVLDFPGSGEDPREFEQLLGELRRDLKPVGILEEIKVREIADLEWRRRRVPRAEAAEIRSDMEGLAEQAEKSEELAKQFHDLTPISRRQFLRTARPQTRLEAENCFQLLAHLRFTAGAAETRTIDWETAFEEAGDFGCPKLWLAVIRDHVRTIFDDESLPDKGKMDAVLSGLELNEKVVLACLPELEAREAQERQAAVARSLVPDAPTLDKLIRYEAHLTRLMDRAIASLLELQRHRGAHARLPLLPSRS